MIKDFLYYIGKGNWRMAKLHLQAFLIWYKIKFIRWVNRVYRRVWPIIFLAFVSFWFYCAYLKMAYDYSLIQNYSHFEALSAPYYTNWNTDGSPGKDPPK